MKHQNNQLIIFVLKSATLQAGQCTSRWSHGPNMMLRIECSRARKKSGILDTKDHLKFSRKILYLAACNLKFIA